jgi:asparagine synthase (glutamine-hydrolysing)
MCGIAGSLGDGLSDQTGQRMLALLRHRGPDEENLVRYQDATLMCARLRIMDPGPRARQPLSDESGRVAAVCNGEIYNARTVANALHGRGHLLRTECDTEILPHLYEEYGVDFPRWLQGMFGLAVLDTETRHLFLVRDRWGVKPLYFAKARGPRGEYLVFASELNALLASGIVGRPDRQAVFDYAALGYIPAPETFYQNVYSLEPGEMVQTRLLRSGRLECRRSFYHRWSIAPDQSIELPAALATCEKLLEAAVTSQSRADVPVGILVSGGIDSSLVAAMRSRQDPGVETFSMRFADARYDESWAARMTADHLGVRNTLVDLPPERGTFEHICAVLNGMGQPFSDTSVFAAHRLAECVRRSVTVCLGGEGGDEAFGGYEIFRDFQDGLGPVGTSGGRRGLLASDGDSRLVAAIEVQCRLTDAATHERLCVDSGLLPARRFFHPQWEYELGSAGLGPASEAERLIALVTEVSTRLVLANDFLVKVDMATMAHGLELRVPMLDEDLFSYALTLPRSLKASGPQTKILLRALAATMLPGPVATKPKWGFSVPPYEWLGSAVRGEIADMLLAPGSRLPEFFRPEVYQGWVTAFERAEPVAGQDELDLFDRVIMLLALELRLASLPASSSADGVPIPL